MSNGFARRAGGVAVERSAGTPRPTHPASGKKTDKNDTNFDKRTNTGMNDLPNSMVIVPFRS